MAGWMGSGDGLLGSVIVGWELGAALAVVGDCVRARACLESKKGLQPCM